MAGKVFVVVADQGDSESSGYVIYELEQLPDTPFKRMNVRELIAASPDTEAALWRYCTELDLVETVDVIARPLDDPIRYRLTEPRQLDVVWQADFVWVRLLDVPAALTAREYAVDAELVIEIEDAVRPEVAGRYRLVASPAAPSASASPTTPTFA